jgi:hypothetical protein
MKAYSNMAIAKMFIGFLLYLWILLLIVIVSNHGLSCVNDQGCLRSYCLFKWLRPEYKKLVLANAIKCPYQDLSTK